MAWQPTLTKAPVADSRARAMALAARVRARWVLVALCVGTAVVETVFVWSFAPSALGLATQASALPPFDAFHDLRWIVVYHRSWVGFTLEMLLFVVVRGAMLTAMVRAAWPRDVASEPFALTFRRSIIFVVIAAVLLAPWIGLMFALAVVSLSWLFFVAIPVVLMLAMLIHGGAVTGAWWIRTISWRSVGIVVLGFASTTFFASVITTCTPGWRIPVAIAAGLVNAWLWVRLTDAVLHRRSPARAWPVAPVGVVCVVALVIVGTVVGFELSKHAVSRFVAPLAAAATEWTPTMPGAATPLLVITGFNTEWDGSPGQFVRLAVPQRRFSYRGMAYGVPLPYTRADTHQSLRDLARDLGRQVDEYARVTGHRLTLVAESEGSLLAKAYLAATPHAPVRNLVVLSPLVAPGRVYYPHKGSEGWGTFGGAEMEGLAWALGGLSPVEVTPDTPFLRSIVDNAPAFQGLMSCALPRVRQAAVLPLDTAVSAPAPGRLGIPFTVVPAFHGGMLDKPETADVVAKVIAGQRVTRDEGWSLAEDVIQAGASAWQVPALRTDVNDAWRNPPGASDCRAIRRSFRMWLRGPAPAPAP